MNYHNLKLLLTLVTVFVLTSTNCENYYESNSIDYNWEPHNSESFYRLNRNIKWFTTIDESQVVTASIESSKPIFCYISQYDFTMTYGLENSFISEINWESIIGNYFIPWEINFWEAPAKAFILANESLGNQAYGIFYPPCIIIMEPSYNNSIIEYSAVDFWDYLDIYNFPYHSDSNHNVGLSSPVNSPSSRTIVEYIQKLLSSEGMLMNCSYDPLLITNDIGTLRERLSIDDDLLEDQIPLAPDYILYYSYQNLLTNSYSDIIRKEIESWMPFYNSIMTQNIYDTSLIAGFESFFDSFYEATGNLYISRTLEFEICAHINNLAYPIDPSNLFIELRNMINVTEDSIIGGYPAYIDIIGTAELINAGLMSVDNILPNMGPRDIVWVNSMILSKWIELILLDPVLKDVMVSENQNMNEFIIDDIPVFLEKMESHVSNSEVNEYNIMDLSYLFKLNMNMYNYTGDNKYLDKCSFYNELFSQENIESWFYPCAAPIYTDIITNLYYYNWLANDTSVSDEIRSLPLEALKYRSQLMTNIEDIQLLLTYDIVNSSCLNVIVLSQSDNVNGLKLVEAANEVWDPRKIVQILDPRRDSELINLKGLANYHAPIAVLLINKEVIGSTDDPLKLNVLINEAQNVLSSL